METVYVTIKYKIVRETSKYNKYIKWFQKCYREDGSLLSSFGYRTEREARVGLDKPHEMPIGNRLQVTTYEEFN